MVIVLDKNCLIETLLIHGIGRPQIQSIVIYINLKLVFNTVKESLRKREGVSQRLPACLNLCVVVKMISGHHFPGILFDFRPGANNKKGSHEDLGINENFKL